MYAIVDIETTGNHSRYSGITEIAVALSDGEKILDKYVTLVNPGVRLPSYITALTGITTAMLEQAPSFAEVAHRVFEMLDGKIFVAHNVNFDYTFLKNQFRENHIDFNAKKLCTVRMSRQIIPGLSSYSLENMIRVLNISVRNRHRAEDDALAAADILHYLIQNDAEGCIPNALKRSSREAVFPPNFSREDFEKLPEKPGVYYFLDQKGKTLYVGKAKNLRSRVLGHFSGGSNLKDKQRFFNKVQRVDFELCGNELVASLLESHEIRRLWPEFNRSQKNIDNCYGIFAYEDQKGFLRFSVGRIKPQFEAAAVFKSLSEARTTLQQKALEHGLCPKLCGLSAACNLALAGSCNGICHLTENVAQYNIRAKGLLDDLSDNSCSYAIIGEGRDEGEVSVVMVENGRYLGFGFAGNDVQVTERDQMKNYIHNYPDNADIQRILRGRSRRSSARIIPFNQDLL